MTKSVIHFVDLEAQRLRIAARIDAAIAGVLSHGKYIMGPEVVAFEAALAAYCGVRFAISTSNGTDALVLPLMAKGIGLGDAVFVPAFTFAATAGAVALIGATPVFVDVDPLTYNLDPNQLDDAVSHAASLGYRPRAVIPVDLFGLPAAYDDLIAVCKRHSLFLLADAAQSCGGSLNGGRVGSLAHATATSFFPAKPLGCYGDGGAVLTDDTDLAEALRSLRVHGCGGDKYDNVRIGMNARLDTIQAAVLLEKLVILDDEIAARGRIAGRYDKLLGNVVQTPVRPQGAVSAFAQYTICSSRRNAIRDTCAARGVPTMVYYPKTLPQQRAYCHFPSAPGGTPIANALASQVLSLPVHPYLEDAQVADIATAVCEAA